MFKKSLLIAVSATFAVSAQAASVTGTFSAALVGVESSTFGIGEGSILSNIQGQVTSSTGDLSSILAFTPIDFSTVTATNGASVGFTSSFGNFIGSIENLMTQPAPTAVVSFTAFGNFTPLGTLGTFDEGPGLLTVSFTQTGALFEGTPQPAISGSFSFASEGGGGTPGVIPEPASWAMLLAGFGLTGAMMRRRAAHSVAA